LYVEFLRTKEANVDKSVNDVYNLEIADLVTRLANAATTNTMTTILSAHPCGDASG
jgi:hypothetical protein